jgi:pyruvate dehydrogenase E1 component alpha subunit
LPENPLLPNRKLRELHALMARCRELDRRHPGTPAREALLAATSMQLLPGDVLLAESGDRAAASLAPASGSTAKPQKATPPVPPLALAASMAAGLKAAAAAQDAHAGLVLAYARPGAVEPGWAAVLEWAHRSELPLLLCCADATGGAAPHGPVKLPQLTWNTLTRVAGKLRLPVLAVDGEDAVAVYRVMQESVIRARSGGGAAVLWAVVSPQRPPRTQAPLARLETYMAARRIPLRR